MPPREPGAWMWAEACELLERAERLNRQFFQPRTADARRPSWEPPVDVLETEGELWILVALAGRRRRPASRSLVDDGTLVVAGERPMPGRARAGIIRRLEIPYGHFERRIELPPGRFDVVRRELVDGCLVLGLRKSVSGSVNDRRTAAQPGPRRGPARRRRAERGAGGGRAAPRRSLPEDALIILPVRKVVLYPGHHAAARARPAEVDRGRPGGGARRAAARRDPAARRRRSRSPGPTTCTRSARAAAILRYVTAPDGTHHIVCQGQQRFRVREFLDGLPVHGGARRAARPTSDDDGRRGRRRACCYLKQQSLEALQLLPQVPPELVNAVQSLTSPSARRRPGRELHGPQARGEAGDPRDVRRAGAPRQGARAARQPHRGAAGSRATSASRPRRRSRAASASTSCASS